VLRANDIITAARDYHPDFNDHVVTGPVLLRQLSMLQRTLAEKVFAVSEVAMACSEEYTAIDITQSMQDKDGLEVPSHLLVLQAHVQETDGDAGEIILVPHAQRLDMRGIYPVAYLLGERLHLLDQRDFGGTRHGWEDAEHVSVTYVPMPGSLKAPADALVVPDRAEHTLVAQLALFMASRVGVLSDLPGLPEEAANAEESLLRGLSEADTTTSWYVRRV
jgi:hypothetical protein